MDYARTVLGLPVPKVLGWSASADRTDVGAEYILMEKVEGVELHQRYKNLRSEGMELINQVAAMEQVFVCHRFSQIGSLYYKEDVEPALQVRPLYADGAEDDASARFRIGPYVDWDIWRGTRANVEADRGPCMFIFPISYPDSTHCTQGRIHCRFYELSSISNKNGSKNLLVRDLSMRSCLALR
jgi:hypothetical protein